MAWYIVEFVQIVSFHTSERCPFVFVICNFVTRFMVICISVKQLHTKGQVYACVHVGKHVDRGTSFATKILA